MEQLLKVARPAVVVAVGFGLTPLQVSLAPLVPVPLKMARVTVRVFSLVTGAPLVSCTVTEMVKVAPAWLKPGG
jgi:hypothetical protein